MGAFRYIWLLVLACCLGCGSAQAEKRVALVIGNSTYKSVPQLANPVNDAGLVGAMFTKAGFDTVDMKLNLNASEMRRTLREFGAKARDADVAVIYYAGHGIELDGNNYLIPTDAALETDSDVLDETLPVDRVLFAVEPAKKLRLIILDACRDNPFAKRMKRTMAARSIGRGLAKVEPTSPNTMIAYAAKAGSTASDGDFQNSPFATALVVHLPTPGLDLRKAFGFVRDDVLKNTGFKQEPYVYGSLGGDDVPLVPAKLASASAPQVNARDAVRRDYELALQLGTRDGWTAFLAQYPDGFYANLARSQLNKIAAEETPIDRNKMKTDQDQLAAHAKVAENTRIAAERIKQNDPAEQRGKEAEATKDFADKQAAGTGKLATDNAAIEEKVAALAPATAPSPTSSQEITKLVQLELHRVGCFSDAANGEWTTSSQRSIALFNEYARTKLDVKLASIESLDVIKSKQGRICPLICDRGFKADGDSCIKIICRTGSEIGGDNSCERIKTKRTAPEPKGGEPPSEAKSKTQKGDSSCSRMRDPVACNCALKTGGEIYRAGINPRPRYRWPNDYTYYSCINAAKRQ